MFDDDPKPRFNPKKFREACILVADGHRPTRQTLRDVLVAMGFGNVLTASHGPEAVMAITAHSPGIVLVDRRLPKLDGLQLTRQVRRDKTLASNIIPVVLMADHVDAGLVAAARDAGVNEIVLKPVSMTTLVKRLMYVLTHPRRLVETNAYVGPDRRRVAERRKTDRRHSEVASDTPTERRRTPTRRQRERRRPRPES